MEAASPTSDASLPPPPPAIISLPASPSSSVIFTSTAVESGDAGVPLSRGKPRTSSLGVTVLPLDGSSCSPPPSSSSSPLPLRPNAVVGSALLLSPSAPNSTAVEGMTSPSSPPQGKKKRRTPYKCHKCGKPKKGHICTAVDPSSLALFKERDARPPQPAYPHLHQHQHQQQGHSPSSPPCAGGSSSSSGGGGNLSLASLAATSSALSPSYMGASTTSSSSASPYAPASQHHHSLSPSGEWSRMEEEEEELDSDHRRVSGSLLGSLPGTHSSNLLLATTTTATTAAATSSSSVAQGQSSRRRKKSGPSPGRKRRRRGGPDEINDAADKSLTGEGGGEGFPRGATEGHNGAEERDPEEEDDEEDLAGDEEVMGMGVTRHAPFLGDIAALYNTSSDNLFPTDALSRYELSSAPNSLEAAAQYGSGSSWAHWGIVGDAPTTGDEDFDISLFGYIDERPPEKVSGVGISLDQRKVPFFVSWFDMASSGLDMLETFLRTQRPAWRALPAVLADIGEQKQKLNGWKENFGKEVIGKALHEADSESARDEATMAIAHADEQLKRGSSGAKRKTPDPHSGPSGTAAATHTEREHQHGGGAAVQDGARSFASSKPSKGAAAAAGEGDATQAFHDHAS